MDALAAARAIEAAHAQDRELVTVTVTAGRHAGRRYISPVRGQLEGTLDEGLDAQARALADEAWAGRAALYADPLFAEVHALAEPLLIFGAGHIAVPLANLAGDLGFSVTVLDDREEFAQPARFRADVDVLRLDLQSPLSGVTVTARTFLVLVTRAHEHDFDCLRAVLGHSVQPRYIGMIGSKRRVRAAFTALLAGGITAEQLATVHAPVGIEIGAETPAEIAVSIAAELVQVRRGGANQSKSREARVLERMRTEAPAL